MLCCVAQAAALVSWLLTTAPSRRPTARQVLASELLPPTVEDQALSDMLRCGVPAAADARLMPAAACISVTCSVPVHGGCA